MGGGGRGRAGVGAGRCRPAGRGGQPRREHSPTSPHPRRQPGPTPPYLNLAAHHALQRAEKGLGNRRDVDRAPALRQAQGAVPPAVQAGEAGDRCAQGAGQGERVAVQGERDDRHLERDSADPGAHPLGVRDLEDLLEVHHPDGFIEVAAGDGEARVPGLANLLQQVGDGVVELQRFDL